ADGDAGRAVEPQDDRRTPATCLSIAVLVLDDEPACLQVSDQAADGGARQTGHPGEVAATGETLPAQGVDDPNAVALAEVTSTLAVELGHPSSRAVNYA